MEKVPDPIDVSVGLALIGDAWAGAWVRDNCQRPGVAAGPVDCGGPVALVGGAWSGAVCAGKAWFRVLSLTGARPGVGRGWLMAGGAAGGVRVVVRKPVVFVDALCRVVGDLA